MDDDGRYTIAHDDLWPRTPDYRYRLYLLADDGLRVLSAAPELEGATLALAVHIQEEGPPEGLIGILDATERRWLVNPFTRQRSVLREDAPSAVRDRLEDRRLREEFDHLSYYERHAPQTLTGAERRRLAVLRELAGASS